jgi:hypothetical protein
VGSVTDEVIKEYIAGQMEDADDGFKVEGETRLQPACSGSEHRLEPENGLPARNPEATAFRRLEYSLLILNAYRRGTKSKIRVKIRIKIRIKIKIKKTPYWPGSEIPRIFLKSDTA